METHAKLEMAKRILSTDKVIHERGNVVRAIHTEGVGSMECVRAVKFTENGKVLDGEWDPIHSVFVTEPDDC